MATTLTPIPATLPQRTATPPPTRLRSLPHLLLILTFWLAIFAAALRTPPLLDDADSTHAQAAQAMLATGDLVTLHVNGIRYLEKAPLPYWIAALSLRLFGPTAFAIHLPLALTVLALALLGYTWSRRAFGSRAALYTALFLLTSTGVFLFTRIFIPDALLSLFLALALYAFLRSLEDNSKSPGGPFMTRTLPHEWGTQNAWPYTLWTSLALAVLTKGLVALIFLFGAITLFLLLTRQTHLLHRLRPKTGLLLFLAVAAPWHILAGLRNAHAAGGHGFFWFYFVNEHFLRFLGRRIPRDYNKLPSALYWSLHLLWLFPWSLFTPAALLLGWRKRRELQSSRDLSASGERLSRLELLQRRKSTSLPTGFASSTVLLLTLFSALVLLFFSLSTNQEYYTFPAYLPLLILLAAALASGHREPQVPRGFSLRSHIPQEENGALAPAVARLLTLTYSTLTLLGLTLAAALAYGLYTSRNLPHLNDIGTVLAHRNVAGYTLSLSHFFDLTGPSFAALRRPATLAAIAFTLGPAIAWTLHARRKPFAAILTIATTSAAFLIAAHLALVRFTPMLSSERFAATIQTLQSAGQIEPTTQILLYGDQSFGSSIPFYLNRPVLLVDGRSTSMLFGSTFPDAPPIFLTPADLSAQWGHGPRKLLFVPADLDPTQRATVDHLQPQLLLQQTSGKLLLTDRPLESAPNPNPLPPTRNPKPETRDPRPETHRPNH